MRGRKIAAVVVAGIAVVVSSIAGAHEDHDNDLGPTAFTAMTPILNVASVEASIEHYTSVLGFSKDWDWPAEEEDKTLVLMLLRLGGCRSTVRLDCGSSLSTNRAENGRGRSSSAIGIRTSRCSTPFSPAFPTSGTLPTILRSTRGITRACSIRISLLWA